jgi:hypothetical protein
LQKVLRGYSRLSAVMISLSEEMANILILHRCLEKRLAVKEQVLAEKARRRRARGARRVWTTQTRESLPGLWAPEEGRLKMRNKYGKNMNFQGKGGDGIAAQCSGGQFRHCLWLP